MTVDEAIKLDNGKSPAKGMVGRAWPEWCDVGVLQVRSGKLTAVDFGVMSPSDGVTIDVAPGAYRVQARIMSFDGSLGICAARAFPEGSPAVTRGPALGNVSVDVARIAIGDIADAAEGLTDADWAALPQADVYWQTFGALVTLKLSSKSIRLACVHSGFGDGTYPAFALLNNGKRVGLEIEFVRDGHVYGSGKNVMTAEEFLKWHDQQRGKHG